MMRRSASGEFSGPLDAPPSYSFMLTPQEFEAKAAAVAQSSTYTDNIQYHDSGPADSKHQGSLYGSKDKQKEKAKEKSPYDEFEDWDDAKFEAAAAAYQARQARQQKERDEEQRRQEWQQHQTNRSEGSSSRPRASTHTQTSPHNAGLYQEQPPQVVAPPPAPPAQRWAAPSHPPPNFNPTANRTTEEQAYVAPPLVETAGQLPVPESRESDHHRGLPARPIDNPTETGPSSPPRSNPPQPAPEPTYAGASTGANLHRSISSMSWMNAPASEDGHGGRASMEALPPFTPIAHEDAIPNIPSSPPARYQSPTHRSSMTAPPTVQNIPPPPPIDANIPPTPSSAPPTQGFSNLTISTSDMPAPSHRHSDIPPTSAHPRESPVSTQRRSEIPSVHSQHSGGLTGPRPPGLPAGARPPLPPNSNSNSAANTRSRALYASANVKASLPSVNFDLKTSYHTAPQKPPKESNGPAPSFYAAAVTSAMKKEAASNAQQRRPKTADSHYPGQSNHIQVQWQGYPPVPGAPNNGQAHPNQYDQGMQQPQAYAAHSSQSFYQQTNTNTYANQQQHQYQPHHQASVPLHGQGYAPNASHNPWLPQPDMWQGYHRP